MLLHGLCFISIRNDANRVQPQSREDKQSLLELTN